MRTRIASNVSSFGFGIWDLGQDRESRRGLKLSGFWSTRLWGVWENFGFVVVVVVGATEFCILGLGVS